MVIRYFDNADKAQLMKIFNLNVPIYFAAGEANDFDQYLKCHSQTYLTVEDRGEIIGGTGYYIDHLDGSGRITWIFFHPMAKGNGLGREVVNYCLKILKAHPSVKKLVVSTSQYAFKFFEKFGYELVKIEKEYWGPGLDLYLMEQPNLSKPDVDV